MSYSLTRLIRRAKSWLVSSLGKADGDIDESEHWHEIHYARGVDLTRHMFSFLYRLGVREHIRSERRAGFNYADFVRRMWSKRVG